MSVSAAVMRVRESVWEIREYQSVDLALLMQHLHDTRFAGRVMLHYSGGSVISAETCSRDLPRQDFQPAILDSLSESV